MKGQQTVQAKALTNYVTAHNLLSRICVSTAEDNKTMVLNNITWLVFSIFQIFSIHYGNEHASSSFNDVDRHIIMIKLQDSIKNIVHRTLSQYTTTRTIILK